jgi:hypothetical protein
MVTLSKQLGGTPMATLVGLCWVVIHILGMVVAAIALFRARMLPLWAAILLGLSATSASGRRNHLAEPLVGRLRWLGHDHADLWLPHLPRATDAQRGLGPAAALIRGDSGKVRP